MAEIADLKREIRRAFERSPYVEAIKISDILDLINSFEAGLRGDSEDERIAEVVRNYIKSRVLGGG